MEKLSKMQRLRKKEMLTQVKKTPTDNIVNWQSPHFPTPASGHLMQSRFSLLILGAQQSEKTAGPFQINAR